LRAEGLLAAACGLWACGGGPPPPGARPLGDLAAEIAIGQVHQEVPVIDLGTAVARPHLVAGWSWDERTDDGEPDETFVWALGDSSTIRFFLAEPRDLTVRLRGRPFRFDGSSPQTVEILADGEAPQRPRRPPGASKRWGTS